MSKARDLSKLDITDAISVTVNNTATVAQMSTDANNALLVENTNAAGVSGLRMRGGSGKAAIVYGENNSTDELSIAPRNDTSKAFTIDSVGNVVVAGNLQIEGSQTVLNTATLSVEDLNITVASGATTDSEANGAGLTVAGAAATLLYTATGDKWAFNKSLDVTGSMTSSGTLTANAGVVVDNITIDGNEIDVSSGNLTLDVAGDIILDADGGDWLFNDGAVTLGSIQNDGNNNLVVMSNTNDKDIKFLGIDNNNTITALTLDMSAAGNATFSGNVTTGASLISTNAIVDNLMVKTSSGSMLVKTNAGANIARFNNILTTDLFGSLDVTGNIIVSGTINSGAITSTGLTSSGVMTMTTPAATTARLTLTETNGVTTILDARGSSGNVGTTTNHQLNLVINNVAKAYLTTGGNFGVANDIQLSTTNPRLDYDGGNAGALRFFSTSANAEKMRITSAGLVGILNQNPDTELHVTGSTTSSLGFRLGAADRWKIRPNSGNAQLAFEYSTSSTLSDSSIQVELDSTGGAVFGGRIATRTSGYSFEVKKAAVSIGDGGTNGVLNLNASSDFIFKKNNTTAITVDTNLNTSFSGKVGINENSLSSNARLQVRYDNSQSYNAFNALTNPSMIIKNLTSGASNFTSLGFLTESNGEGAISLVQGSGNINADMTFAIRSSGTRAEHMRITHDGNVGIGTDSPIEKLDVNSYSGIAVNNNYAHMGSTVSGAMAIFGHNIKSDSAGNTIKSANTGYHSSMVKMYYNEGITFHATSGTTTAGDSFYSLGGTTNELMRITNDGNVGIGTPTPGEKLHVEGSVIIDAFHMGDEEGIFFREGFSNSNKYNVSIMAKDHNGSSADGISINGYDGISFCTGSNNRNEVMRIIGGSSGVGNVGIGTTSPAFTAVSGSTNQIGLEIQNGNNDSSAHLKLTGRNNTGTPGQATSFEIIHRGDALKTSFIHGGTEVWEFGSSGHAHLGMNDSDTRLTFGSLGTANTNSSHNIRANGNTMMFNAGGGSGNFIFEFNGSNKLALDSTGKFTLKTANTADAYNMIVETSTGGDPGIAIVRPNTAGFGIATRASTTDYTDFQMNDAGIPSYTETGKMRIYSNGNISIPGTALWSSTVGNLLFPTGSHYMVRTSSSLGNESMIISNTVGTGGQLGIMQYRNGGSIRGDYLIATNTAGIYFSSASDYRFKENISTIEEDHLTKLTSLRPVTYTEKEGWQAADVDTETVHTGFIAHEVEEVYPEFVEGEKDALWTQEDLDARGDEIDPEESVGDPKYQTVAYTKKEWNVYMIRALQQLKAENEALKARLDALEGGE